MGLRSHQAMVSDLTGLGTDVSQSVVCAMCVCAVLVSINIQRTQDITAACELCV